MEDSTGTYPYDLGTVDEPILGIRMETGAPRTHGEPHSRGLIGTYGFEQATTSREACFTSLAL
jgi:hypothetical protein